MNTTEKIIKNKLGLLNLAEELIGYKPGNY